MFLSVVIPCYNEEKNIPLLFERFNEVIEGRDMEVVFVNNGSTDHSQAIFDRLLPEYHFARLVKIERNQGYGYGILQGLKLASGEYIGWTHADLQTDPKDVIKAYDMAYENGGDNVFIKGRRKNRLLFDRFFTAGMSAFESLIMGMPMNDINAQPTIFPQKFFYRWNAPPNDFSLDLYVFYMAMKQGLDVIRFPVFFPERIHGVSNWNTSVAAKWKFIKRTVSFSINLKRRGIK